MKRIVVVLGVAAVMAAAVALTAAAALAQAANADHYRERLPVSEEWTYWCTGETVTWEGWVQDVSAFGESNGGSAHSAWNHVVHLQGTSDSGAKYILHQTANTSVEIIDYDPESGAYSELIQTIRVPVTIIRQGEDGTKDDFGGQVLVHYTQKADGETTAQVEVYKAECR